MNAQKPYRTSPDQTTHYTEEAEQSCDRVALMHQGSVRALGTPTDLAASYDVADLDEVFGSSPATLRRQEGSAVSVPLAALGGARDHRRRRAAARLAR